MVRSLLTLLAAAVLSAAALCAQANIGRRAPGFALPDLNFNYHDLYDYRGKVVMLEFMKTSCPICNSFQRVHEKLRAKYGAKLQILTVVLPPDNQMSVGQFIAQHQVKTPILFDSSQVLASYLKATPKSTEVALPHVFLIDPSGIIRKDYIYGAGTEPVFDTGAPLMKDIDGMLGAAAAPKPAPAKPKSSK
jgi:peroxiredoxin